MKELTTCRLIDGVFIIFFILGAAIAGLNYYVVEQSAMNTVLHIALQAVSIGLICFNVYALWKFYIKKYFFKK